MSKHDPFDGVYDGVDAPTPSEPKDELRDEPKDEPRDEPRDSATVMTVYSSPFLRRQSKADLQRIAGERDLDTSGGRDDLIERIEDDQKS